jgi:hypothetical protein
MAAEPGTVQFSIGRVIGDSFGVLARNIVSFGILALLISLLQLLFEFFVVGASQPGADPTAVDINWGPAILGVLIAVLVSALTQAAIIYGTFQDLRGQKAGIGDCISRGFGAIVPVIVGSILLSIAVGIGFMLLIVPGIILVLMWWVYIPAVVVESKGIIEAFGRSRELTRGHRWHILGLIVVVAVLMIAVSFVVVLVVGLLAVTSPDGIGVGTLIISYVLNAFVTAFNAVLVAVSYYYLRAEKEGVDVNEIARIFD